MESYRAFPSKKCLISNNQMVERDDIVDEKRLITSHVMIAMRSKSAQSFYELHHLCRKSKTAEQRIKFKVKMHWSKNLDFYIQGQFY
jgi:hypothetical protein